jgi:large subunit ribosomal protein L31
VRLQVFCNGEEVMTTSGTQPQYTVDIWSGNHPFFKGSSSTVVVDEGRVNRFKRRYAGLDTMADMSTMKQGAWRLCSLSAGRWASCCDMCHSCACRQPSAGPRSWLVGSRQQLSDP